MIFIQDFCWGGGEKTSCWGLLGRVPQIEIIEFRDDKFQLSKCNARIHTEFCVEEGEGKMCGRRT